MSPAVSFPYGLPIQEYVILKDFKQRNQRAEKTTPMVEDGMLADRMDGCEYD